MLRLLVGREILQRVQERRQERENDRGPECEFDKNAHQRLPMFWVRTDLTLPTNPTNGSTLGRGGRINIRESLSETAIRSKWKDRKSR